MQTYWNGEHLVGCNLCIKDPQEGNWDGAMEEDECDICGATDLDYREAYPNARGAQSRAQDQTPESEDNVVEGEFGGPSEEEMDELDKEREAVKEEWAQFGTELATILEPVVLPAIRLGKNRLPRLIERSFSLMEKAAVAFTEED